MVADMLTKGLHRDQFTKLCKMSGIVSMLVHQDNLSASEEEC